MAYFPVSSSILSASHLATFLQQQYELKAASCSLIKAGISHTYLVSSGDIKYVFRVYTLNWRTITEIEEEIRLINLLKSNGIPVSYPIKDTRENYIQYIDAAEGQRMGVMFSFAEGEKILDMPVLLHYEAGKFIAQIHRHTNMFVLNRVTYTPEILLTDSFEKLKQFLPADCDERIFMENALKYLLAEFEKADTSAIRQGAVHMDIWFDNFTIKNNKITLFDFDFCGNGWLCNDVAYYILHLHSMEPNETKYYEKLNSFLEGYESMIPLSAEEKRVIPILVPALYFFYLGVQSERFENWANVFLNETYLKRYISARVKKWFDFNKIEL